MANNTKFFSNAQLVPSDPSIQKMIAERFPRHLDDLTEKGIQYTQEKTGGNITLKKANRAGTDIPVFLVSVTNRKDSTPPFITLTVKQVSGTVPVTLERFIEAVFVEQGKWMSNAQTQILESYRSVEGQDYSYDILKDTHSAPRGISDREFIAVRTWRFLPNGAWQMMVFSIDDPRYPESPNTTRGQLMTAGWLVQPEQGGISVHEIMQVDIKGKTPHFLVAKAEERELWSQFEKLEAFLRSSPTTR
ncbi:hypothetical protein PROFUN_04735 [Planoprotostelium fungivorum]|uniref:START domain-containing protein n=1 Tax=Planoprotostelium fungivorum TaxID=1890364 RepID=A0A2P6NG21_9EUKA|nr:hypothetical protein PROFUN_04735 [Planoprotostelium fungivorum]